MADKVLKAIQAGSVTFAGICVACAVLENEMRVLTQKGLLAALGCSNLVGRSDKNKGNSRLDLSTIWAAENLEPYSQQATRVRTTPVRFRLPNGELAVGYDAKVLPEVCKIYGSAQLDGVLRESQLPTAYRCQRIVLAIAEVGIDRVVDEATGYRSCPLGYAEFVGMMIAAEVQPWFKRFRDPFCEEIARLKRWKYTCGPKGLPRAVSQYINKYVYNLLPPEVRKELRRRAAQGNHVRLHQGLSDSLGIKWLEEHLRNVTLLLKSAPDWEHFEWSFQQNFPQNGDQIKFWLGTAG